MDKYTFGKTPAAIYLADRLNFLNDPKYTRKISSRIHDVQTVLSQAITAHEAKILDLHSLNFIAASLRTKVEGMAISFLEVEMYLGSGGYLMPDPLSVSLMCNVLVGDLKSIIRRTRTVKLLKVKQLRAVKGLEGDKLHDYLLEQSITTAAVSDEITAETLVNRSRAKLKRKGHRNTLYE